RALALLALNRQDEALADLDKALAAKPDDADTWYNSGNVLAALNRFEEALARYDRALAIDPRRATFHNNRGNALRKLDRLEEALASYDGALAIAPDLTDAHYNRGNALGALRRDEEALASYARVLAIGPKHLPARWAMVMHSIPVAAGSREEMEAGRKAFAAGLEDLAAHLADGIDAESAVYQAVPFYLAYHEENNRAVYARYGELCVRATGSRPLAERPPRPSSPRLRLGIVSAQVRRHSVWDALLKEIVRHLDPNRIEIDIFHLGALTDAETEWAASRAAHFEQGPHEPRAWVERILARRPDVLLYPEICTEPRTTTRSDWSGCPGSDAVSPQPSWKRARSISARSGSNRTVPSSFRPAHPTSTRPSTIGCFRPLPSGSAGAPSPSSRTRARLGALCTTSCSIGSRQRSRRTACASPTIASSSRGSTSLPIMG